MNDVPPDEVADARFKPHGGNDNGVAARIASGDRTDVGAVEATLRAPRSGTTPSPRVMPLRVSSGSSIISVARDEVILDAAEKLFYERGFNGVGVDQIGQAAGVTGSAIYRHFDSKDEILAMLFDRVIDSLLTAPPAEGDPEDELHQLATSLAELARSHRQLAGIWEREHRALAEPYKRRYHRRMRKYIDRWVDCLDLMYPGHDADYLRTAVRAVHAMLLSDATRSGPAAASEHTRELVVDMAVRSLHALADGKTTS